MNANELADELLKVVPVYTHPVKEQVCKGCGGEGAVGNILDTVECPFCHGEGVDSYPVELTDEEIERAIQMLKIASEYIRKQYPYGVMFYDDADCDGACIADDCESIIEQLSKAILRKEQEK